MQYSSTKCAKCGLVPAEHDFLSLDDDACIFITPESAYALKQYSDVSYVAAEGSAWQFEIKPDDPSTLRLILGDMSYHAIPLVDVLAPNADMRKLASAYDETGAVDSIEQIMLAARRLLAPTPAAVTLTPEAEADAKRVLDRAARRLLLDMSNPLEASMQRLREQRFEYLLGNAGFGVRHIESGTFVADGLSEGHDAIEIADALNNDEPINLYYELPEGGGNEQHADVFAAIAAFDALIASYPDAYARLHPLSKHKLVINEHVPARYRNT